MDQFEIIWFKNIVFATIQVRAKSPRVVFAYYLSKRMYWEALLWLWLSLWLSLV